ncbi:MAG: NAD(+) synthase [Gammaproteobacteria bacterium]|nr:MAG: NAD(+) synthase [Gammaproteobacteria bacterium]
MRGFARIAAAVPSATAGNVTLNRDRTLDLWREAHRAGVQVMCFPEMGIAGYSIRDLVLQETLLDACEDALVSLIEASHSLKPLAMAGLPLRHPTGVYNCAAVIQGGKLLGVVPKAYLPNYREFEEARWYRPGIEVADDARIHIAGVEVPFGTNLLFAAQVPDLVVGAEICEDMWVQSPPSMHLVSGGATIIGNLSASNFTVGKAEIRRTLATSLGERGKCAYIYVAAGPGESSTDVAFDADAFICELDTVVAESERFKREGQLVIQDIDLERLAFERRSTGSFGDCAAAGTRRFRRIPFTVRETATLVKAVSPTPFIPSKAETLATRCWETFEIQSNALATRMTAIGKPKLVLGVSGGLDSTHAALVSAAALDLAGQPRSDLVAVTMPGFGTSDGTRSNAETLAHALGADFMEIGISDASRTVLQAVGHPAADESQSLEELLARLREKPELGDVTLENIQARMRTLVLMSLANSHRGIVVGTGDLSEKALGWSTYAGDHIAMYDVNAGVPKTLIQFLIRWVANERATTWSDCDTLRETLFSILDTPISPELLPADASGRIAQLTEETIGPYELHDFYLFHFVRGGARPGRILDLARQAFDVERYDDETLRQWLLVFLRRFFTQQFKRSCTADGPKVLPVALSPRGDWRMPSDANVDIWLTEAEAWEGASA